MTGPDEVCAVCRRGDAPVCERCRTRMAEQVAALPGLRERLRVALVPGQSGGERVSATKGEAPMPARLAALTLIAGGSDDARCLFVPAVRVWCEAEAVIPFKAVVTWHREVQRDAYGRAVMTLVDDQSGVLPLRMWVATWALEWRFTLGHSDGRVPPARTPRHTAPIVRTGDDPVAGEWDARWPDHGWGPTTARHHAYLSTWLTTACDRLPFIADFAASLRTLTGAARAALGDIEDLEYVGRCPEEVEEAGARSVCGAAIWHDPYASVITCPRCHTETGQDRRIWLARRILDAWPIDRRRRYPRGLIEVLRIPACVTCSAPVVVEWVPATERADRELFWRPGMVTCPRGCERAS